MDKGRKVHWNIIEEVTKQVQCQKYVVTNVVKLLDEDNTVPFIARYRRDQTGCLEPDKIREIKEKVEELKKVETKAISAVQTIEKLGKLDKILEETILNTTDIAVIEDMTAAFKQKNKTSALHKALQLDLATDAGMLLQTGYVKLSSLVRPNVEGCSTLSEVKDNLAYVVADLIAKEKDVTDVLLALCHKHNLVYIKSRKVNSKKINKSTDIKKFEEFFDFDASVMTIKPYKYLALKRGENLNVLKTTIEIKPQVEDRLKIYCNDKYISNHTSTDQACTAVLKKAISIAYDKLIEPRLTTITRNELRKVSEKASIDVFASNLTQLLMTKPVRKKHIFGVDPGFTHGCKFALINPSGDVLEAGVFYLNKQLLDTPAREVDKVKMALLTHKCEVVAIGNGVGCREAESFFSHHIGNGTFAPLNVSFSIVQENGASIYSASDIAKEELPDLDITLRGAVSIARRLQDPLVEMIKIEPKNLGIGMYQHDVSESKLKASLDGVIEDCVSFVGVDVNICSESLLRHVAGIGPSTSKKIIAKRDELGCFKNRRQLLLVSGLGEKKFLQCAGFLRINIDGQDDETNLTLAENKDSSKRKLKSGKESKLKRMKTKNSDHEIDLFDKTSVHPESYTQAALLVEKAGLNKCGIGHVEFVQMLKDFVDKLDLGNFSKEIGTSRETLCQIIDSLTQLLHNDIRNDYNTPLFRQEIRSAYSLKIGQRLIGQVTNVTDFGAFVDIGVGMDGLLHVSSIPNNVKLFLGNQVSVLVTNLLLDRKRIGLSLGGIIRS